MTLVKQVSVFLENSPGRLAEVTQALGAKGIDIGALSLAETTEFGVLRLIVNDPVRAAEVLIASGYAVTMTDVLAVAVRNEPGGLARAMAALDGASIGVEYLYAFVGAARDRADGTVATEALVIIRVEEPEKAAAALSGSGIRVLSTSEVYGLL